MPRIYKSKRSKYPVIRFINEDLGSNVNRFAKSLGRNSNSILRWSGIGKQSLRVRLVGDLPIWFLEACAKKSGLPVQEVLDRLHAYYDDWEKSHRFIMLNNGEIKPAMIIDYISLHYKKPFSYEKQVTGQMSKIVGKFHSYTIVNNLYVDGSDECTAMIFSNGSDSKCLYSLTYEKSAWDDNEVVAEAIILKLDKIKELARR